MTKKEAERNRNSAKAVVEAFDVISGGKWKWKPRIGDEYLAPAYPRGEEKFLVCCHTVEMVKKHRESFIPIFPWEILEEIVCSFGFETGGPWWHTRGKDEYEFGIFQPKGHWTGFGKKRYESVVNSLLELAKDLKKK